MSTENQTLKSWIDIDRESDFTLDNIPFGIFSRNNHPPRVATRIGNMVIDLYALSKYKIFSKLRFDTEVFNKPALNDFMELNPLVHKGVREALITTFEEGNAFLRDNPKAKLECLNPASSVSMHLPVQIGDYTDFYSSIEHATNVGIMFRDPENALLPNWKHIPVGYHGRSSSIVVSGTNIHRPKGQFLPAHSTKPSFGPSRSLDFELEMAFITRKSTKLGQSLSTAEAEDYIFGMVIFNDLSARDIQKWEYVPLGPFLGKNFGSVISPWVITLEALKDFKVQGPKQDPPVLPYLRFTGHHNYDIELEVYLQPENSEAQLISHSNHKYLYWNILQQLTHQSINGCNIRTGDMYASGTISGPEPGMYGSMLELAWKGTKPLKLADGSERKFIEDNDTIIMKAFAEKNGKRIGFGESVCKILPAL